MSDPPPVRKDPDLDSTTIGRAGQRPATVGVISLSREECWSRLRAHEFGRLAVVIGGGPRVFPMNYAVGEDAVVFRTLPGTKLDHGPGSRACLEIDGYEERSATGWSVMVLGELVDITDTQDARSVALRKLPVRPVAPGVRQHWLALIAEEVTGRYFRSGWTLLSTPP
jgi:nitroimidazol reductase NimA-like FMN-containing flavoprotein (pyridoxamine 5'-phosphate oxidase superfamily)